MSSKVKIAWLIPSISRGYVWQPIFEEFNKLFPENVVFTGERPISTHNKDDGSINIKTIGRSRFVSFWGKDSNYKRGIILPPLNLPFHLIKYSPDVIFTTGFSIWTMIAVVLKLITRWKIVVVYDGSSPGIDVKDSKIRLFFRRLMTKFTNAFITNTNAGKSYLANSLGADKELVFSRPYQVADKTFLSLNSSDLQDWTKNMKSPVFLYIGLLIKRKGIDYLLNACSELRRMGHEDFTLLIVGDGENREELKTLTKEQQLEKHVKWAGWVEYEKLGSFLEISDVFVFPTFEDIWGIVVTEAMSFGKPVLCSKLAGACELVREGENGHTFDPVIDPPEIMADIMSRFIVDPDLCSRMGNKSREYISNFNPQSIAVHLGKVVEFIYRNNTNSTEVFSKYSKN